MAAQIMSVRASSSLALLPGTKPWCHSSEKAKSVERIQARIENLSHAAPGRRIKNALIQSPAKTEYSTKWAVLWKYGGTSGMSFPGTEARKKMKHIHKSTGSQTFEKLFRVSFIPRVFLAVLESLLPADLNS